MKFGFVLPNGDARTASELAYEAEQAGWDAFFVWEPVWGNDAWVCLTAAAMRTERIRLGTMISPLSRMRPWKIASETATLDNLSNGRVILSVGLGAIDSGFVAFGEQTDRKIRAELLDEALDIVVGLWKGQPFTYQGKHYTIQETNFLPPPPPVQQPRIPIWVVGAYPYEKSMQRALRYDGLLTQMIEEKADGSREPKKVDVATLSAIHAYVQAKRAETTPFDIVVEGESDGNHPDHARATVQPWAEAGATWWIETLWSATTDPNGLEAVRQRIRQGPPRLEQ